jgi:hypothetical protein
MDVLGALIERVSGQRFGAFLEERMFGPLGMKDTGFDVPAEKMSRLAKTYKLVDGKFVEDKPIIETWPEEGRGIKAGGAATTYCQIDPKEKIVAIALAQHFPFNQHNFFAAFQTGCYQALK